MSIQHLELAKNLGLYVHLTASVVNGGRLLKNKLIESEIDAVDIRFDYISLNINYQRIFIGTVERVIGNYGLDGEIVFLNDFKRKFTRYAKLDNDS